MGKTKYNNEEYKDLIIEFFGDLFYSDVSYGTKIQKIRQYTEIILRRLLEYPCDKNIEIGNEYTLEKLDKKGFVEPLFREALEKIRSTGNERTHTKFRRVATEEEYEEILDSLFNLYAYLFFKNFEKYGFGTNKEILTAFSLLPPIIRHITLTALYENDDTNIDVIDKLVLAKIKALGKADALLWVENNKDHLMNIEDKVEEEYINELIEKLGPAIARMALQQLSKNMYEICCEKIAKVGGLIDRTGPKYKDFETAKFYYENHGRIEGNTREIAEFNDLMEFIYIGRRAKEADIEKLPDNELILNKVIWVCNSQS